MKTDDLIGMLAADHLPPAPLRLPRIAGVVLVLMAAAVALFLWRFGVRDALGQAIQRPVVAAKMLVPLTICAIALPMALMLMRPDAGSFARMRGLFLLPLAVAAGLWLWAFASLPPDVRFADVSPFALTECLGFITAMSLLPLGALLLLMRRGASPSPARAGAMAGLGVASGVAAGYSMFCVMDNPLFYVTWYGVAILTVTALGAVLGGYVLRW